MPTRRTYLLGAGSLFAASAGCATRGGGGDGGTTPTATPLGTPTDDGTDASVTVEDVVVRKAVGYESLMGSGGVLAAEGEQYVVASVSASGEVSASQFAFEAGGESRAPGLSGTVGATNRSVAGRGNRPLGHGHAPEYAYLAFAVPSPLSASDPRITYAGGDGQAWPLEAANRDRLAAPEPTFELEALDVPEAVQQGQTLYVSMQVTNTSETDGRFLAAVYWPTRGIADDDESHVVEREVDAGASATTSLAIDTRYTAMEDGPVQLRVRGHVTADREVHVSGASPPA